MDHYVFEGYKLNISFSMEKLKEGSPLWERIISCLNGQVLINDPHNYYAILQEILEFSSETQFIDTLERYLQTNNKIYNTYIFKYNDTQDDKNILKLEPAGEGVPSYAFTVDLS